MLLKHSNSQALNQQRLETYLASASQPSYENGSNGANGTETLRDLDTRIRILELFTLHVLPRNNDWGYAREFIKLSDILDDEKKEQFILTLDALKEEKDQASLRAAELQRQRDEELEQQKRRERDVAEKATAEMTSASSKTESPTATSGGGETYGIRDSPQKPKRSRTSPNRPKNSASSPAPVKSAIKASSRSPSMHHDAASPPSSNSTASSQTQKPVKTSRGLRVLTNLFTALMRHFSQTVSSNPMGFLRFVMVITGLLMALRRPDVRGKLKSVAGAGWGKIASTVGMGTKVSYI